ncbi:hypothetical protein C7974DRAFT_417584 [Boeremia exigua]|uniref:uncharacterized protein n=1 Tax=Boeremia exigua TaxID=749465 RepID=UPI001E8DED1F|nr:uncharacterized protein C7974DRAFT_417584 [Boeremia exigua]KAH6613832.1 hypothetical protein C7974DRAFT_417584 [Boeremia exigua]
MSLEFGSGNLRHSNPYFRLSIDIGTSHVRFSCGSRHGNYAATRDSRLSNVQVPTGTRDLAKINVGSSTFIPVDDEEFIQISPIKDLILQSDVDKRFEDKGVLFTRDEVLAYVLKLIITEAVAELCNSERGDTVTQEELEEKGIFLATTFPAAFSPMEKTRYLTYFYAAFRYVRKLATSEPVAATYKYAPERKDRTPLLTLMFDFGGRTVDCALILCNNKGDIKTVHQFGVSLGVDVPLNESWKEIRNKELGDIAGNWNALKSYSEEFQKVAVNDQDSTQDLDEYFPPSLKKTQGGLDIRSIFKKHWIANVKRADNDLNQKLDEIFEAGTLEVRRTVVDLLDDYPKRHTHLKMQVGLCGGGPLFPCIRGILEELVSRRGYRGVPQLFTQGKVNSAAVVGLDLKVQEMMKYPLAVAPITICLEQNVPHTLYPNRIAATGGTHSISRDPAADVELLVLALKGQAITSPKLPVNQAPPTNFVYMDSNLEYGRDAVTTFKATFSDVKYKTNQNHFLVAQDNRKFYCCAELRISCKHWSEKTKALTALKITIDMEGGTVECEGILYSLHKWNAPGINSDDQFDMIEREISVLERLKEETLENVKKHVKDLEDEGLAKLHTDIYQVVSLNMEEYNNFDVIYAAQDLDD